VAFEREPQRDRALVDLREGAGVGLPARAVAVSADGDRGRRVDGAGRECVGDPLERCAGRVVVVGVGDEEDAGCALSRCDADDLLDSVRQVSQVHPHDEPDLVVSKEREGQGLGGPVAEADVDVRDDVGDAVSGEGHAGHGGCLSAGGGRGGLVPTVFRALLAPE